MVLAAHAMAKSSVTLSSRSASLHGVRGGSPGALNVSFECRRAFACCRLTWARVWPVVFFSEGRLWFWLSISRRSHLLFRRFSLCVNSLG